MARLSAEAVREAAALVLQALQEGGTLPPFPDPWAPRTPAQGRRIAAAVLAGLDVPVVGLRLAPVPGLSVPAVGPILAPRLLRGPAAVPCGERRTITLALVAQLRSSLPVRDRPYTLRFVAGRIASLHVAFDLAETRFTRGPPDLPAHLADLSGLGLILFGRPASRTSWVDSVRALCTAEVRRGKERVWRGEVGVADALRAAAEAVRSEGGLPAGAVLAVGGLSPPLPDEPLRASIRRLGSVERMAPG